MKIRGLILLNKSSICIIATFFAFIHCYAQKQNDKHLLRSLKADQLIYETHNVSTNDFQFRLKKTKKWGYCSENVEIIPPLYDSLGWFHVFEPYITAKNNGRYGIILNPNEIPFETQKVVCRYSAIKTLEENGQYFCIVKKNNKWGLIDWFTGEEIFPPIFENFQNVPLIAIEEWEIPVMQRAKQKFNGDIVIFDHTNGDGIFKIRNKTTQKWGMYQDLENGFKELIPVKYDSVAFFGWNSPFTMVYQNGKTGIFLSRFSDKTRGQSVECKYDEAVVYNMQPTLYLMMQRDGYWGWVDWLTGEEKTDFKAETPAQLYFPEYKQHYTK